MGKKKKLKKFDFIFIRNGTYIRFFCKSKDRVLVLNLDAALNNKHKQKEINKAYRNYRNSKLDGTGEFTLDSLI